MVFGKKQILMATLVVALGAAIYLHSTFNIGENSLISKDNETVLTNTDTGHKVEEDSASSEKNYGDIKFVNAEPEDGVKKTAVIDGDDYFVDARLTKKQSRDAVVESFQEIINSSTATDEEKSKAINSSSELTMTMDVESNIENLVKAKGFADCIAFIDNENANIVVKTPGLLASEAAQIKDIIVSESGISAHNISVVEKE